MPATCARVEGCRGTVITRLLAIAMATASVLLPSLVSAADASDEAAVVGFVGPALDDSSPRLATPQSPLRIAFRQDSSEVQGRVSAVVDRPLDEVVASLSSAEDWCDVLLLHLNVKYCRAVGGPDAGLRLALGRKTFQSLDDVHWLTFDLSVRRAAPDGFEVELVADRGPFDTYAYRIRLRGAPMGANRSELQFEYSFRYGLPGKLAMSAFLATSGQGKVGFTTVPRASGELQYVTGLRGAVERNVMRYFLAIAAHLQARDLPLTSRAERRFALWFDSTERYARQLREMDRTDYLAMKRRELARQLLDDPVTVARQ
jgi:hypothetical protein